MQNDSVNILNRPGFLREKQILGDTKAKPPVPAIIPVGRSTWWQGVKDGKFPAPIKLSERCTAWKTEDIRELVEQLGQQQLGTGEDGDEDDDDPDEEDHSIRKSKSGSASRHRRNRSTKRSPS